MVLAGSYNPELLPVVSLPNCAWLALKQVLSLTVPLYFKPQGFLPCTSGQGVRPCLALSAYPSPSSLQVSVMGMGFHHYHVSASPTILCFLCDLSVPPCIEGVHFGTSG